MQLRNSDIMAYNEIRFINNRIYRNENLSSRKTPEKVYITCSLRNWSGSGSRARRWRRCRVDDERDENIGAKDYQNEPKRDENVVESGQTRLQAKAKHDLKRHHQQRHRQMPPTTLHPGITLSSHGIGVEGGEERRNRWRGTVRRRMWTVVPALTIEDDSWL